MPNGNPNFEKEELPLLETFFAKISSVLEDFADSHNLRIEKYYHEGPEWAFEFKHPDGGRGQIEVEKTDENSILIRKSWSIDDYATSTRFMKYVSGKSIELDHSELHRNLENAFDEILRWKKNELVAHKAPYPWSKRCSKEEFEARDNSYPIPKID